MIPSRENDTIVRLGCPLLLRKMPFKTLLVDEHKIMRDGIQAILRHSDEFLVVAEAESGSEAIRICGIRRPDIVLMYIGLPGLNGIEAGTDLLRLQPGIKITILSVYHEEHSVVGAIRSGARAFVLKRTPVAISSMPCAPPPRASRILSAQGSELRLHRIERGDLDPAKPLPSAPDVLSLREIQSFVPRRREQDQQRNLRPARSRSSDRPQLSQDHDEEGPRKQRRRPGAASPGLGHHAFTHARIEILSFTPRSTPNSSTP